jgi:hypothetical protein
MSQDNAGKVQRPFEGDNANNAAELVNVKEEYKALEKKLREAEQKAQMAKNEVRKIHMLLPEWEIHKVCKIEICKNYKYSCLKSGPKFNLNV